MAQASKMTVRAGTQFIDGVWRILRRDIRESMRHSNPELVDKLVLSLVVAVRLGSANRFRIGRVGYGDN